MKIQLIIFFLSIGFLGTYAQKPFNKVYDFGYFTSHGSAIIEYNDSYYIAGKTRTDIISVEDRIFIAKIDKQGQFQKAIHFNNPLDSLEITFLSDNNNIEIIEDSIVVAFTSFSERNYIIKSDLELTDVNLFTDFIGYDPETTRNISIRDQLVIQDSILVILQNTLGPSQLLKVNLKSKYINSNLDINPEDYEIYKPSILEYDEQKDEFIVIGTFEEYLSNSVLDSTQTGVYELRYNQNLELINKEYFRAPIIGGQKSGFINNKNEIITSGKAYKNVGFNTFHLKPVVVFIDSNKNLKYVDPIHKEFRRYSGTITSIIEDKTDNTIVYVGIDYPYRELTVPDFSTESVCFIGKLSFSGDSIWHRDVFDLYETNDNLLRDVILDSEGHYVAVGVRLDWTEDDSIYSRAPTWVIKIDKDGHFVNVGTTSTENINSLEADIRIFPNPTDGIVFIEQNINTEVKYRLVNINGQLISEKTQSGGSQFLFMGLQDYSPGIYFLNVYSEGLLLKSEKIVVK